MKFTVDAENVVSKEKRLFVERKMMAENVHCDIIYQQNCILFINHGSLILSYSENCRIDICTEQMVVLSAGKLYNIFSTEECTITFFFLSAETVLSKLFSDDTFLEKKYIPQDGCSLKFDQRLNQFLINLYDDVQNGIDSSDYIAAKTVEFYYLLEARFRNNQLCQFFMPIFTNDQTFSTFIWMNYQKVKTIKELASLSCYSVSGFEKRFKRVFGIAASHWMKEQKANDLLREMRSGNKPLKQIMLEYGFFSASHFNNFCKTRLGYTPGRLIKSKSLQ